MICKDEMLECCLSAGETMTFFSLNLHVSCDPSEQGSASLLSMLDGQSIHVNARSLHLRDECHLEGGAHQKLLDT